MPNCRVEYDSPVPGTHSHTPPMGWDDPEDRLQTHWASQHAVLRAYPIEWKEETKNQEINDGQ